MKILPRTLLFFFMSCLLFVGASQSARAVNVAIVDTGIDPGVLGGVIEAGGFDFFNNDDDPSDDATNSHGTAVGFVTFSSGSPITLTPIKAFGPDTTSTTSVLDAAFNYVASLNTPVVTHANSSISATTPQFLINVANSGKIVVMSAGNKGTANPTGDAQLAPFMGGRAIVAGGLGGNGDIGGFSARAGNLAEHYLLADATSLITASVGTSMASGRIAAAAASVMAASPFLRPEEVVSILFESAVDVGAPGPDPTYGQGILDMTAALSPVGTADVPTDDDTDTGASSSGGGGGGGGAVLGLAALGLGGAWAAGVFEQDGELQKTILVDKYGRAFNFDFSGRLSAQSSRPTAFSLFHSGKTSFDMTPLTSAGPANTFALVSEKQPDPRRWLLTDEPVDHLVSFIHRFQGGRGDYVMGLNSDLSGEFGALSFLGNHENGAASHRFVASDVFSTPVLGYSSMGSSLKLGWNGDHGKQRLGVSVVDDQEKFGQRSNSVLFEKTVEREQYLSGFQVGALLEDNSLLGGSSNGLFGTDQTNTYYLGLNGAYRVTPAVTLFGSYFHGLSSVDESRGSLLDNFSTLRSEGYGLGMVVDRVFSDRGSFGIAYSRPMQTVDGSARLTVPVSQDRNGEIGFSSTDLSFKNTDQETILETYYQYRMNDSNDLFAHFSYTRNPIDEFTRDRDRTVYFGWKHRF